MALGGPYGIDSSSHPAQRAAEPWRLPVPRVDAHSVQNWLFCDAQASVNLRFTRGSYSAISNVSPAVDVAQSPGGL